MELPIFYRTDSYKVSQWPGYDDDIEKIYSYLSTRGGKYPKTIFFGLRYYLERYLSEEAVKNNLRFAGAYAYSDLAANFYKKHFMGQDHVFNQDGFERLFAKHGNRLPIEIRALPEGSLVPHHVPHLTIVNTDDEFPWLTNWLETLLLKVWYPTNVATQSFFMRLELIKSLIRTGFDPKLAQAESRYKLQDFGYRGSTSEESAGIGGMSHLTAFGGTDTVPGILFAQRYYNCKGMPGYSVPATEHSLPSSFGRERERESFEKMMAAYPDAPIVSLVVDTYDVENAVDNILGKELRDKILARPGKIVARPDSGDAAEILPRLLESLGKNFGYTVNSAGFKELNTKVGLLQGDGIDPESMKLILNAVEEKGWATSNYLFGSGGALLQKINRDTNSHAIKCSAAQRTDGKWYDVQKDPKTDQKKKSLKGRFTVHSDWTIGQYEDSDNVLQPVFRDGEILVKEDFETITARVEGELQKLL